MTDIYNEIANCLVQRFESGLREPLDTQNGDIGYNFDQIHDKLHWITNQIGHRVLSWCDDYEIEYPLEGISQLESLPSTHGTIGVIQYLNPKTLAPIVCVGFRVVNGFNIDRESTLVLLYKYFEPSQTPVIPPIPADCFV